MKIIHIAGWSGSGKTTFIRELVKGLSPLGKVGSIKHIGDHICELPSGKDTTVHYEAGACITAGIDQEKTMITCQSVSLSDSLDFLADSGVRYAVVEGFKRVPFRKVVIGDLDVPAFMRNPSVDEVITLRDEFDDYYSLSGLFKEFGEEMTGDLLYSMTSWYENTDIVDACMILETEIRNCPGVTGVRIRYNQAFLHEQGRLFVVVKVSDSETGSSVLTRCAELLSGFPRKPVGRSIS